MTATPYPTSQKVDHPACVRFENQTFGQEFRVGDSFMDSGTTIIVKMFHDSNPSAWKLNGNAEIQTSSLAPGSGKEIFANNVNLAFHFGYPINGLSLKFWISGGPQNIEINGEFHKFDDIDVIIPVPLHKKKLRKRGYNQSDCIAEGLHSVIGKPVDNDNLIRVIATNTQTNKTRFERFKNVSNIFDLKNPEILKNKHILLIDDIVTTGSTLESCILTLQKINNVEISISTLAVA